MSNEKPRSYTWHMSSFNATEMYAQSAKGLLKIAGNLLDNLNVFPKKD